MEDVRLREEEAKKKHGYSSQLKTPEDVLAESRAMLEKYGLAKPDEKVDQLGFTMDFYKFIGLPIARDYAHPIKRKFAKMAEDMKGKYLTVDTANFYTPMDDMYGSPSGTDTWYDYGRVPVSHLLTLCTKRVGVANRACVGPASDVFDNDFEFVKRWDQEGDPLKTPEINSILGWIDDTFFQRKCVEILTYDGMTGLGHLAVEKYVGEPQKSKKWRLKAPNTRPEKFKTFSAYQLTPNNISQSDVMDYDKQAWNFTGGLSTAADIHHSRVYVLEMRREEMGLRGLALPELCWVANMCYLNVQYYILKSLAQLGIVTVGVNVDREFPNKTEVEAYLSLLKLMQANNFYVLGRNAKLVIENAAGKLGSGIRDFMEFLKEDMSAAWIFPKNQLFGRSDGGGLDGAGALVSKEDYLSSNVSVKQSYMKRDVLWILKNMCHFDGLDDVTLRFNIDLHKTEEQRLKEEMMREQVEQAKLMTEQQQLQMPLLKEQVALQTEMAKVQREMFKKNPEAFMMESQEDEANLESKTPQGKEKKGGKGDFVGDFEYLKLKHYYQLLQEQYNKNVKTLDLLNMDNRKLQKIKNQNAFVWKTLIIRERQAKD